MTEQITIHKHHRGRVREYVGTVAELVQNTFGYTLECGHSHNYHISRFPQTAKALVKALNQSVNETQGGCFEQDAYYLVENGVEVAY